MKEKVKKIFFIKSNWFFIIFLLISSTFFIYLNMVFEIFVIYWETIRVINWEAISAIVLIGTGIAVGFQAYYTKKHVELSAKSIKLSVPGAFFILRSLKTIFKREKRLNVWEDLLPAQKLKTQFIVANNSKSQILFKVKIIFKFNSRKLSHNHYWENPLCVNPGITSYPDVIHLDKIITDQELENIVINEEEKEIFVDIEYKYTPRLIKIYSESILEHRNFNLKEFIWEGPNGIRDENIYLPGEKV